MAAALTSQAQIVFSDINLSYGPQTADPNDMVYNEVSLNNAIITILGTRRGSRVFRRDFGSLLVDLLWDPIDDITARRIQTEIIRAIGDYEPRISLISTRVLPDYDNQQYFVEMEYQIPQLNNRQVTFNFNLDQQRA